MALSVLLTAGCYQSYAVEVACENESLSTFDRDLEGWSDESQDPWLATVDRAHLLLESPEGSDYFAPSDRSASVSREFAIDPGNLIVDLDYRVTSEHADGIVTNAFVRVETESGELRLQEALVHGGTTDTGWQTWSRDLSDLVANDHSVRVVLWHADAWETDHREKARFDNIWVRGRCL